MGAIDEAWHGDDVSRPMNLVELCRKGPFKGVIEPRILTRRFLSDYSGRIWTMVFGSLLVAAAVQSRIGMLPSTILFLVGSLGSLMVASLAVAITNIHMHRESSALSDNPMAMPLDTGLFHKLVSDPIPGTVHAFRFGPGPRPSWSPLYTMNRSDGDGNQVMFFVFDDDHDRVMFRLAQ